MFFQRFSILERNILLLKDLQKLLRSVDNAIILWADALPRGAGIPMTPPTGIAFIHRLLPESRGLA